MTLTPSHPTAAPRHPSLPPGHVPPKRLPLSQWNALQAAIADCNRCPRLRKHCLNTGQARRAAFRDQTYWARPVPNLGDPAARLLILGLAPAAHGANRTGRMFTGDRSGDFLFQAMHAEGFCNQPTSVHADDGLRLIDCAITATAHCAPPENKPTPREITNCRPFLNQTVDLLPALHNGHSGILVLGKIAFDAALALYKTRGWLDDTAKRPRFAHGALFRFPAAPFLLCTYHPSQQNTFTGRLTQPMLRAVFATARRELNRDGPCSPNP